MRPSFCHSASAAARSSARGSSTPSTSAPSRISARARPPHACDHAADERQAETGAAIRLRHAGRRIAPIGEELLRVAGRCDAGGPDLDAQPAVAACDTIAVDLAAAARRPSRRSRTAHAKTCRSRRSSLSMTVPAGGASRVKVTPRLAAVSPTVARSSPSMRADVHARRREHQPAGRRARRGRPRPARSRASRGRSPALRA